MFTSQFNRLIEERNTSIYQISRETQIPATTLYDWMNGRTQPKFDNVVKLSEHFDVPLEYFTQGDA